VKKRRFLIRWSNRLLFAVTLLVGMGSLLPTHLLAGASVLTLAFPVLIFPQLITLLLSLRYAPKLLLLPVLGIGMLLLPVLAQIPFASDQSEAGDLRVASYNVRAFYQEKLAHEKMAKWASDQQIDILCMQEMRKSNASVIAERFPFRAYAPKWSDYSVAIYSAYPILRSEPLVFDRISQKSYAKFSAQFADIALPQDTIRILNVHLSSTGVRDGDMSVEPSREDLMETSSFVARKIAASDKLRGLQSEHIIEWVEQSPYPVVLTGDFNGVPGGNLYARLMPHLRDPYIFKGHGAMGSFEPLKRRYLPIRIDWTLHSPELESTGQSIDLVHLSDHFPLITTFAL